MKELTAAETLIMKTIWDGDHEMALAEITERVNSTYGKAWKTQTVSTYLAKLVQKEFIHMKREGRRITYEILVAEDDYRNLQARKFVNFWNKGSIRQFLAAFYKGEKLSKNEIKELREIIDTLD